MQTENRLFEDFVKMANGVAGTFAGMAREGETGAKEKLKGWLGGMDFVSREEFEAVKAMAAAARDEVEALRAEIAALQAPVAAKPRGKTNPPPIQD
jgi:BMFP domain-containing protein YqiC